MGYIIFFFSFIETYLAVDFSDDYVQYAMQSFYFIYGKKDLKKYFCLFFFMIEIIHILDRISFHSYKSINTKIQYLT